MTPSRSTERGERLTSAGREDVVAAVDAVRRVLRALRLAARETLATTGVSAAQLFVLAALADGEDASLSELAERTLTDRTSATAVVDRLLEAGLVTKRSSRVDRRRAAVRITPRGRAMLRGAPRPPTALLVDALERLDRSDLRGLAQGLAALTRAMGIEADPAQMLFEEAPGPADSVVTTRRRVRRGVTARGDGLSAIVRRPPSRDAR